MEPPGIQPPPSVSADEIAVSANASDLFVFRRVGPRRFAHIGGAGRGAGWAGIVEVGLDEEPTVEELMNAGSSVVRRAAGEPWHVIGPYYARAVAVVRVSDDVFVLFGAMEHDLTSPADDELEELARYASDALQEVAAAKRLADEVEALNAVRDLLHSSAETFEEAAQHLVDQATISLSCDLGLLYVDAGRRVLVSDQRGGVRLAGDDVVDALAEIASLGVFPLCIQEASERELPAPFRSVDGVLAYYLLELERPLSGVLLLLHTTAAAPRGFTLLCQSLGRRLVEAAEPLLASALLRDTLREDLDHASTQARRDPLTGLANRLAWNEAVSRATASEAAPSSVVLVDCCGLKLVNDTYGHRIGDEQLCRIAAVLRASVRGDDLVARLGGDEFGVLLLDANEATTRDIVGRVEVAAAEDRRPGRPDVRIALGAATSEESLEAAQHEADARLLDAKRAVRRVSTR
jgi:diguanylate cyclase (GGDEF)-like protein